MLSKGTNHPVTLLLGSAALALLGACNQAGVDNAGPRLTASVPDQNASGGTLFTLDLAPFVVDRESSTTSLTFSVVTGGGMFSGATYSHTFDTLGAYDVVVRATDPVGKSLDIDFKVTVRTANLAVTRSGDDLRLLDTDTLATRPVAAGGGFTVRYRDFLGRGQVVYERQIGSDRDLFIYDANTTATIVLGEDPDADERYAAKIGNDRVLFTVHSGTTQSLRLFNVATRSTVVIAEFDNEIAGDPLVTAAGLVYFERTQNGQNDIFLFDPSTGATTTVSDDPRVEEVLGTAANGALVFSRRGAGGETDLYYYERQVGVLEIGADVTAIASLNKQLAGATGSGLIVFTTLEAGQLDLYLWNPATGTTTAIGTSGDNESFAAVLPNGNILFYVLVGGTDLDVRLFDVALGVVRTFPASNVTDIVAGTLSDNRVVVSKAEATGTHLYLATYNGTSVSEVPIVTTNGQNFALVRVLANDNIVYRNTTSGGVTLWVPGTGGTVTFGATSEFVAAMPTVGDFVVKVDNGGQFDLVLFDDSAGGTVSLAAGPTDEETAVGLSDGRILFTRAVVGGTERNLFVWRPTTGDEVQATSDGPDHSVEATFAADNR